MALYADEQLIEMAEYYSEGIPEEDYAGDGTFGSAAWVLDVFSFDELGEISDHLQKTGIPFTDYLHSAVMDRLRSDRE
ncbi:MULTISPECIES: hypothetical protein [unclassified Corynebacterium]|uniref:hypothetical protein n=1 Tax=unclassified Corynebacterium TaxID=2624378 RepID=UPI0029CA14B9|nr:MULTISPECIES: hypothetical protein [unclassified Corynebacterium]WPF66324.1 hypothetical protein OLX12_00925 [Corynebacterium sp. 22KM0430]WPF68814.1 hypothetical protein OLW90_00925 [Corynebacterium sp. 21KM1197]